MPKTTDLLQKAKDNVALYAAIAGVIYGLGWLSETAMAEHLGLGSLQVLHEQAVVAGITTVVCLCAPLTLVLDLRFWNFDAALYEILGSREDFASRVARLLAWMFCALCLVFASPFLWVVVLCALLPDFPSFSKLLSSLGPRIDHLVLVRTLVLGFATSMLVFILLSHVRDDHLVALQEVAFPNRDFQTNLLICSTTAGLCYICLRFARTSQSSSVRRLLVGGVGIAGMLASWSIFVDEVLPCLSYGAGGLMAQDVYIRLKASENISGIKVPGPCFQAFLLAADDKFLIFAHGYRFFEFQLDLRDPAMRSLVWNDRDTSEDRVPARIFKVPIDEIEEMRQPYVLVAEFHNAATVGLYKNRYEGLIRKARVFDETAPVRGSAQIPERLNPEEPHVLRPVVESRPSAFMARAEPAPRRRPASGPVARPVHHDRPRSR
jgi:hypothetical protein